MFNSLYPNIVVDVYIEHRSLFDVFDEEGVGNDVDIGIRHCAIIEEINDEDLNGLQESQVTTIYSTRNNKQPYLLELIKVIDKEVDINREEVNECAEDTSNVDRFNDNFGVDRENGSVGNGVQKEKSADHGDVENDGVEFDYAPSNELLSIDGSLLDEDSNNRRMSKHPEFRAERTNPSFGADQSSGTSPSSVQRAAKRIGNRSGNTASAQRARNRSENTATKENVANASVRVGKGVQLHKREKLQARSHIAGAGARVRARE
ncbi:unnamed protein product [Ilex paraguariensis]|uniref:Uncharacterized protein n=1 Tax=Ilex paraguariensis TaxID=185542 RepID=A0ABC8QME7_9AQUA